VRAKLQAAAIIKTIDQLKERIGLRFPDSGLKSVCGELAIHARTVSQRARRIGRPYLFLRFLRFASILAAVAAGGWLAWLARGEKLELGHELAGLTSGLDAGVHLILVAGGAVWTLLTLEARLKRSRALGDLYRLRSFAHIVDMHQLTKDPTVILSPGPATSASPNREMNQFQLTRYLDYCSEMLSLIGKLAALYGEYTRDPQVVDAIHSVEDLCGNLSRKIWQKITILSALDETAAGGVPANAP
jgi:hypothetical protein